MVIISNESCKDILIDLWWVYRPDVARVNCCLSTLYDACSFSSVHFATQWHKYIQINRHTINLNICGCQSEVFYQKN